MRGTIPPQQAQDPIKAPFPPAWQPPLQPRVALAECRQQPGGSESPRPALAQAHLLKHLGTSCPKRCCCQNCSSAAPKRQEENVAGCRERVQGGSQGCFSLHHPTSSLHPSSATLERGGQKSCAWSHLPHGIPGVMKAGGAPWPKSCWGAQRRHSERRERPRAKASIALHHAALISALKRHRNFITLRQLQAGFSSSVPLFIKHPGRPAKHG